MSKPGAFLVISLFASMLLFFTGCSAPTPIPPASTPIPPTRTPIPTEEAYGQVNPSELMMDIQSEFNGRVDTDRDGNVTNFGGGKISSLTVAGKPIELASNDFLYENQKVYISTKDYGKFLLSFNSNFTLGLWLKPSQAAKIKALAVALIPTTAMEIPPTATFAILPPTDTPTVVPITPTLSPILATATRDPKLGSVSGSVQFDNVSVPIDQVDVMLIDAENIDAAKNPMPVEFQVLGSLSSKEPKVVRIDNSRGSFSIDNIPPGKYLLVLRSQVKKTDGFAFCNNNSAPNGWGLVWLAKIDENGQPIMGDMMEAIAFNTTSSTTKFEARAGFGSTAVVLISLPCK